MGKRPDLAGHLIQADGAVYLVEGDGTCRWIPDPQTLSNLFTTVVVGSVWVCIPAVNNINDIDRGPDITSGAILASPDMAQVYLIDNGHKRLITNFEKFHFDRERVVLVPDIALSYVPSGPNMT